jgi:hypothetical protein
MARDALTGPLPVLVALATAAILLASRVDAVWTIALGGAAGLLARVLTGVAW